MRYLWCCCTPDGDVPWLGTDAVGFHITEKDEFTMCRVMSNEIASTIIHTSEALSVVDGHEANRDIWEDDLVLAFCMKAAKRDADLREMDRLTRGMRLTHDTPKRHKGYSHHVRLIWAILFRRRQPLDL